MIIEIANIKLNVVDLAPERLGPRVAYEDYIRYDIDTDVDIKVTSEEIDRTGREFGQKNREECIESAAVRKIYESLLDFDAFVLHAASISVAGKAFAFSAAHGTGKTTHMNLWKKKFGGDYCVVNGDRTVFRRDKDGRLLACGSPWCGKERWQTNVMVPVRGICFLERSEVNWVRRLDAAEAVTKILKSTLIPGDAAKLAKLMDLLEWVTKHVPVYLAGVNMDDSAADVVYEAMR